MNQQVGRDAAAGFEYGVRRFRSEDVDAYLDLREEVLGTDRGREWFAWRYEDNPYVYHVPIFVAERDGELVAARPFFALGLSVNGRRRLALQPDEALVHPDHRGEGLLDRLDGAALEAYHDGDPSFLFDFTDARPDAGAPNPGWERVGDHHAYCRVHDPAALMDADPSRWASVATDALKPLVGGYNRLSEHRLGSPGGETVQHHESIPAALLAGIEYDRRRNGIHVHRDARFYDWRFDDPTREYTAYVAERDDEPVAALVVGTSADGRTAEVIDVTPLPQDEVDGGLEALLRRVVREHADSALVVAPPVLPDGLARRAGFRRDDRWPVSRVRTPTTHVVRGLADGLEIDGVDVTDADNWRLTFSERDAT